MEEFRNYVNNLKLVDKYPDIEKKLWTEYFINEETGQCFAKLFRFDVKTKFTTALVPDERHRGKQLVRTDPGRNAVIDTSDMKEFSVQKQIAEKQKFAYRVYNTGKNCYLYPDAYLVKGDVIQRDLKGGLPASHEGIYMGNGRVIHNDKGGNVCETTVKEFAGNPEQQIRVVDYIIWQKKPEDICALAEAFLRISKSGNGQKYNFFFNNCQHFTSLCATGVEFMTDQQQATERILLGGIIILVIANGTVHNTLKTAAQGQELNGLVVLNAAKKAIEENAMVLTDFVKNNPPTARTKAYTDNTSNDNGSTFIGWIASFFKGSEVPQKQTL